MSTRAYLRGLDAMYAATCAEVEGKLVSWDQELVQSAGAMTPVQWLERAADKVLESQ